MRKVALISTYCDNEKKIKILSENITIIKNLGLDVFVISPIILPKEIIEKCDYVFFTKENPLLVWPQRDFTFWKTIEYKGTFVKMHRSVADYGWAALNQIKRLSEIALNHDYDIFYHFIYDLEIDDLIKKEILSNEINFIHPRINPNNPNDLWEATLHFMVFDKTIMNKIVELITFENYNSGNGFAEGQALDWCKKLPITIKKEPIKDKVYFWENHDFFDYSKNLEYKLFINKHHDCETIKENPYKVEILDSKLRLFFYDVKTTKNINIICDNKTYNVELSNNEYVTLENDSKNVKKLIVDNEDYSDIFEKIIRNISYIN